MCRSCTTQCALVPMHYNASVRDGRWHNEGPDSTLAAAASYQRSYQGNAAAGTTPVLCLGHSVFAVYRVRAFVPLVGRPRRCKTRTDKCPHHLWQRMNGQPCKQVYYCTAGLTW